MPKEIQAADEPQEIAAESAEEEAPEAPEVEGVVDSPAPEPEAPYTGVPVDDVVFVTYVGELPSARVLGVDYPQGKRVGVDPATADYIERMHALDACFVKE